MKTIVNVKSKTVEFYSVGINQPIIQQFDSITFPFVLRFYFDRGTQGEDNLIINF